MSQIQNSGGLACSIILLDDVVEASNVVGGAREPLDLGGEHFQ